MPFFNGKGGSLTIEGASYPMEEWSLEIEIEEVEVTNFLSGGFKSVLGGIAGGSISASGPYDGTIPFAPTLAGVIAGNAGNGAIGTFIFGVSSAVTYTWGVLITGATVSQNAKEKATLEISGSLTNNPAI